MQIGIEHGLIKVCQAVGKLGKLFRQRAFKAHHVARQRMREAEDVCMQCLADQG